MATASARRVAAIMRKSERGTVLIRRQRFSGVQGR
jgi:hypothetical protein